MLARASAKDSADAAKADMPPGVQPNSSTGDGSPNPATAPGPHAGVAIPGGGPDQGAGARDAPATAGQGLQALEGASGGVGGLAGEASGGLEGSEAVGKGTRAGNAAQSKAPGAAPNQALAPQGAAPKGATLLAQLASAMGAALPQAPSSAPASYPQLLQAFDVTVSGARSSTLRASLLTALSDVRWVWLVLPLRLLGDPSLA